MPTRLDTFWFSALLRETLRAEKRLLTEHLDLCLKMCEKTWSDVRHVRENGAAGIKV